MPLSLDPLEENVDTSILEVLLANKNRQSYNIPLVNFGAKVLPTERTSKSIHGGNKFVFLFLIRRLRILATDRCNIEIWKHGPGENYL